MKPTGCEYEVRILEALAQGQDCASFEEPLRRHAAGCTACAELIAVHEMFQKDAVELRGAARVPEAGRVWWRARLAARRAAAERALRPIMIAERAALAVGGGVLLALLILVGPWLAQQLARSSLSLAAMGNTSSLAPLITASLIVCLLLMAGGLYALWAEK